MADDSTAFGVLISALLNNDLSSINILLIFCLIESMEYVNVHADND